MSWVNGYIPNLKQCETEHKGYTAQLLADKQKVRKANKLVRKDYTKL